MILVVITTTIIPIVDNLSENVSIDNESGDSGRYTRIGSGSYTIEGGNTLNGETYSERYGIISDNIVFDKENLSFKDSTGTWIALDKTHGIINITITDGIGTVAQGDQKYTTGDISDGYILDKDGEFGLNTTNGNINAVDPLIAIYSSSRNSSIPDPSINQGIMRFLYIEIEKSEVVYSVSLEKTEYNDNTYDNFGTIESFNGNGACNYEVMDGYIQYTVTGPISVTTSFDDEIVNYILYPLSIDFTLSKEGPEYDLIRVVPIIMIAGVVIASIGAFVISRRE